MAKKKPKREKRYRVIPGADYEATRYSDNWLRFYREKRGLTLQQLADFAEMSKVFLANIERGHKQPSLKTAKKLAVRLGVRVEEIFPDEETPTPREVIDEWLAVEGRSQ